MSRDPIDRLSARLFEAARDEAPPDGAERRVIEAARRELPPTADSRGSRSAISKLLLIAAAFAVAALWLARREEPAISIRPEPLNPTSRARPEPASAPSAPRLAAPAPSSVAQRLRDVAPAPARSAPVTLSDEIEVLKAAEGALSAGDPRTALKALDRYDRVLKGKKMRAEASVLRMEALFRSGQREGAAELARRFVEQNPTSPLVDRARSFIEPSN